MSEEIVKKGRGRPAKFDGNAIIEAYKQGKTMAEVASQIGCSVPCVLSVLKKNGITIAKKIKEPPQQVAV